MVRLRFDDRRRRRSAFSFAGLRGILETRNVAEVLPLLRRVEESVNRGSWAAGFVAYEAAPAFDPAFTVPRRRTEAEQALPLVWFALFDERVPAGEAAGGPYRVGAWRPGATGEAHRQCFARIRAYIERGDTYQVNQTYPLVAGFEGDPLGFYADLLAAQSAAYCAYLDTGRLQIASASPELFFVRRDERVTCKPMKGTAPRGRWREEDREAANAMASSAKERAENVMIVDLIRNDLGKVARFGSVHVDRLFEPERYETVWQLTSTVSAELRPGTSTADLFAALFPCGSVTGAPKKRTMEVIAELEPEPRGVYCGAIGILTPPGSDAPDATFNVAIRTVVIDAAAGTARYGVGGGITHDSRPDAEFAETVAKAHILTYRPPAFELLETLRWEAGAGFFWLDRHLDRMEGSADYWGFDFDRAVVKERLEAAVAGEGRPLVRVRLTVARDGTITVAADPLEPGPGTPVRLAVDTHVVDPTSPFLFNKTTFRTVYEDARWRHPDADDVLLLNPDGQITESSVANLIALIDGRWLTPPVASGCLPGIYRQVLLDEGEIHEAVVTVPDLDRAERLALINSVRLTRPAVLM